MWEERGGVSEREVLKSELDKRGERMYANKGNDGDGLRREEIVEGGEMEVRTGAKVFVCDYEHRKEDLFANTDEEWVTGGREEMENKSVMEEMAELGFQWSAWLKQSMSLIVSRCAVDMLLEVWRWRVLKRL